VIEKTNLFIELVEMVVSLHALEDRLNERTAHLPITPLHYKILQLLYFDGDKSLTALSECLGLSLPNASREIKKLEAQLMVNKKSKAGDLRSLRIELSPRGIEVMTQSLSMMEDDFYATTGPWDQQRTEEFRNALRVLKKNITF